MSTSIRPRIGGMALANGLMVHGPTHWAAAVRGRDGAVTVRSGRKLRLSGGVVDRFPVLRGVLRIAEAMVVLPAVRFGTPHARFAMECPGAAIGVVAASAGTILARRYLRSPLAKEAVAASVGLLPALLSLRGSRAAVWHAVEHKNIAAYEAEGPAGLDRAAAHPKEHERCGSNLILPLVATSTAANVAMHYVNRPTRTSRMLANGIGAGLAVEVMAFTLRKPTHPLSRIVRAAGHQLQARVATREPNDADMAVGRQAMETLIAAEALAAVDERG